MSTFAPNLSTGPCLYCSGMAESGPEEMLRCEMCRNTAHICCLKSGTPDGMLEGDNFFTFTCALCKQSDQDITVRAKLNIPQLLLLVLYNLHISEAQNARKGFYHWKVHIYQYINQHWKEIFGPERHKKKKKTLQASLSGQLSHYGQYFVSGYDTLQDGGWYRLSMVLPPAQLIGHNTKAKAPTAIHVKEESIVEQTVKEEITVKEEPEYDIELSSIEVSSSHNDESSQGSWFMEKDILRPHSLPPLTLFDSEEEMDESQSDKVVVKREEEFSDDIDMEFIDVDDHIIKESSPERPSKTSLLTIKNPLMPNSPENTPNSPSPKRIAGESICALSTYEERKLLKDLKRFQEAGPLLPDLHRLYRKLVVRKLKHEHGVHRLDLDAETNFYRKYGRLRTRQEKIKVKNPIPDNDAVRVLDRFQVPMKDQQHVHEKHTNFLTKLIGSDGPPSLIHSPYTLRKLKPFIMRDHKSRPLKLRLLDEIIRYPHRHEASWSPPPRHPIDYCYVTPKHIPAMNHLARHFFWPGIDLSEVLQYPDHTCVVLYRHLVIGFGVLVPDTSFNTAYLSFLLVHPEWQRAGIATFMLYHLIQTCMGKDVTLHVSVANPALILYQKFGFKVEEFLLDFYDKYLPEDSNECKHAMFLRLSR